MVPQSVCCIFFKSHKNELVPLVLFLFFGKIKIIKAFFFCGLRGNFLHCCTLWFGCRFVNLFPYSVPQCSLSAFRLLNWILSIHAKENIKSLVDKHSPIYENFLWSFFNLSTSTMPSMTCADGWIISPAAGAFFCSSFASAAWLVFRCDLYPQTKLLRQFHVFSNFWALLLSPLNRKSKPRTHPLFKVVLV